MSEETALPQTLPRTISPRVKEATVLTAAPEPSCASSLHFSKHSMALVPPTYQRLRLPALLPPTTGPLHMLPPPGELSSSSLCGPHLTFLSLCSHVSSYARTLEDSWRTVKSAPITFHKSKALISTGTTVHVYLFTSLLSTSLHCDVSTVWAGLQPARALLGSQHLWRCWVHSGHSVTICRMNVCKREALCPERAQNQLKFLSLPLVKSFSLISSL